jgi:hypothetical protein
MASEQGSQQPILETGSDGQLVYALSFWDILLLLLIAIVLFYILPRKLLGLAYRSGARSRQE